MAAPFWQSTEDWHTAGEPFRIVHDLPAGSLIPGLNVWEQRMRIIKTPSHPLDLLRRSLCHEPRGHADMYGGFIVPPDDSGAHFGVLFFHRDGFSTACGHGTIALGHWAIANQIVKPKSADATVDVVIDVPSGRVTARTACSGGVPMHVDFINVASYQIAESLPLKIELESIETTVEVDISFGGAVYVSVDAGRAGIEVVPQNHQNFINVQKQVRRQLANFIHEDRYDIYGVIFFEEIDETTDCITQRNVVVFANGQVDRSPCGSGTAARVATLLSRGRLNLQKTLLHQSILGTTFLARVESMDKPRKAFPSCIPAIRGTANLIARSNFYIDPAETLYPGFLLQ